MILGVLSDSHGHPEPVRQALALFDQAGVERIIHCGDVGGADVFSLLLGRPFDFTWGNTDEPDGALIAFLESVGIHPPEAVPLTLDLDGKSVAVFHGHEPGFFAATRESSFDYIFYGHTHLAADERRGRTRIINPGALHRARRKTVAVLDTATDDLSFHEIATPKY